MAYQVDELYHYGVLGMKWGVRRYQPYASTGGRKNGKSGKEIGRAASHQNGRRLSNNQKRVIIAGAAIVGAGLASYGLYKTGILNRHSVAVGEQIARSNLPLKYDLQTFAHKSSSRKTVRLKKDEYAHVMSELASNISKEEKTHPIVRKAIGDYVYTFENNFDDTYRVIRKRKIPQTLTGLYERLNDE